MREDDFRTPAVSPDDANNFPQSGNLAEPPLLSAECGGPAGGRSLAARILVPHHDSDPDTLERFARHSEVAQGVALESLEPGTVLAISTRHSQYRLVVLDGARRRALVTGGAFFPESTEVRVHGATVGGSALKVGWIGIGLRLELSSGHQRITTSRVESIAIASPKTVEASAA